MHQTFVSLVSTETWVDIKLVPLVQLCSHVYTVIKWRSQVSGSMDTVYVAISKSLNNNKLTFVAVQLVGCPHFV